MTLADLKARYEALKIQAGQLATGTARDVQKGIETDDWNDAIASSTGPLAAVVAEAEEVQQQIAMLEKE
ncbi:hypothetical protein [Actinoplanes sp. NPDC089786]|uniref:hypothetical protein n=1 Tax=Actinoplanes sp. NPDC089786 TaxID=3155185 RepID=UPI00341663E8